MKKITSTIVLILLIVFITKTFSTPIIISATNYNNNPITVKHWNDDVYIQDDAFLQTGDVLQIDPGVHVYFTANKSLTIEGDIQAYGYSNPILFTGVTGTTKWYGIILQNNSSSNSYFINCEISHAKYCGLYLNSYDWLTVLDCNIHNNGDDNGTWNYGGIFANNSNWLNINGCIIHQNHAINGGGISLVSTSNCQIGYSQIDTNYANYDGGGIALSYSTFDWNDPSIYNNEIKLNESMDGGGIYAINSGIDIIESCIKSNLSHNGNGSGISLHNTDGNLLYNSIFWNGSVTSSLNGGGIYLEQSSPLIFHGSIAENHCGNNGGGLYIDNYSNPIVTNVFINSNNCGGNGGGIYSLNILDSIYQNDITGNYSIYGYGGGIYIDNSAPGLDAGRRIAQNNIANNHAAVKGGAIYAHLSSVNIRKNNIQGNYITSSGGEGGGICLEGQSSADIRYNTISGNHVGDENNVSVTGNGGAIALINVNDNTTISPVVINNLIVENHAYNGYGGGLYINDGGNTYGPYIYSCTFSDNTSDDGAGIYSVATQGLYANDILYFNVNSLADESELSANLFAGRSCPLFFYSDIYDCNGSNNCINSDPEFHRNLGPNIGDPYGLINGSSPAIDAGSALYPHTMYDMNYTILNNRIQGTYIDMGCYEQNPSDPYKLLDTNYYKNYDTLNNNLVCYPNPCHSYFYISFSTEISVPSEYEIYNLSGEVILTNKIISIKGENKICIDMRSLNKSIYFCKTKIGGHSSIFKIIVL